MCQDSWYILRRATSFQLTMLGPIVFINTKEEKCILNVLADVIDLTTCNKARGWHIETKEGQVGRGSKRGTRRCQCYQSACYILRLATKSDLAGADWLIHSCRRGRRGIFPISMYQKSWYILRCATKCRLCGKARPRFTYFKFQNVLEQLMNSSTYDIKEADRS